MARYVQKGTKLLFEMHYTPNGTAQKDRSYVGFKFADPKTVKKEVAVQNAGNFTFKIPAGDPNYEVESEFVFRQKTLLLSVSPHMHVRGKDFRYDLIYPGRQAGDHALGSAVRLWLADDLHARRAEGSCRAARSCTAWPTSTTRPTTTPTPIRSKEVTWGEQTWEEMMFGWFEMSLADQDLTKPATAAAERVKEFLEVADTIALDEQIQGHGPRCAEGRQDVRAGSAISCWSWCRRSIAFASPAWRTTASG